MIGALPRVDAVSSQDIVAIALEFPTAFVGKLLIMPAYPEGDAAL
ncbi:hypothetical protein ACPOLB_03930 [Rubrivivax sp. RP6-9]